MADAYQWVLATASEQTTESDPWTSERYLVQEGRKPKHGHTKTEVRDAISQAKVANDLIGWHGLLAPATPGHLQEIIEAELDADITRRILIGKCNRYLQHARDDAAETAGGDA